MADIIMFHHAQGLTDGLHAFADHLRQAGHHVVLPDLYEGVTFPSVEDGVAYAEQIGFEAIIAAGESAAADLPPALVYAGFSLGVLPAQKLAQTRPGASGALIYHGDVPVTAFGPTWPAGVDVQVHVSEHDPWCDAEAVRELVTVAGSVAEAELFVYPGSAHLFTDSSLPDYDRVSADLVLQRSLAFLARIAA